MRRIASLDILRGLAIIIMLILHVIKNVLDIQGLIDNAMTIPVLNLILVMVLPLLGGLAGLFLMVSSIGNMISMTRQLQSGRSPTQVVLRQVIGGILLLIFAMVVEGVIGYNGQFAEFFRKIGNYETINWNIWRWRWSHMATIHTIAWGQILNGIVHGILAGKERWKNYRFLKNSYLIGAIVVLGLTALFWWLARYLYPGYPGYNSNGHIFQGSVMYIYLGETSFKDGIVLFFLGVVAGHPEPIFPFLIASFLGSIIGLYLMQDKPNITYKRMKHLFYIGFIMVGIGLIGFGINLAAVMKTDLLAGLDAYINLWDFTFYTQDNGFQFAAWLFISLLMSGISFLMILSVFLLVELRGGSRIIAKRTLFIRKFGTFAFTIYTIQGLFDLLHYLLTFWIIPYDKLQWGMTFLTVLLTLLLMYGILWIWEKFRFIGTVEWTLGIISLLVVPGKTIKPKLWVKGCLREQLDFGKALHNEEWLDLDPYNQPDSGRDEIKNTKDTNVDICYARDSKLALFYSLGSLVFFPYAIFSLILLNSNRKKGYKNKRDMITLTICIVVLVLLATIIVLSLLFNLQSLGIDIEFT
ncbi:MAG: heparan-alpha-glucosaminide N-acetyltransferase domain-containing protein [Promethearchaeota archaeon]